jgi:hypothetical protein
MAERIAANIKSSETRQTCTHSCKQKPGFNSSGSSADRILQLQRTAGNQAVQRLIKSGALQAKLKISQPNDVYEQEADRVAEQVMRMPEPIMQRQPIQVTPLIQRQVPVEKEEILQAKDIAGQSPTVTPSIESRISGLQGGGQPLDSATRAFFEPRFGQDLSTIRIHNDSQANELARAINARAYTVGKDVGFDEGQYSNVTENGKKLLAHEIAHVMQQSSDRSKQFIQRQRASAVDMEKTKKPLINYRVAKNQNHIFSSPDVLGWETKLETVVGGNYKSWSDLWRAGNFNEFADAVAEYQSKQGWSRNMIDGILGLKTWTSLAGLGEAIAGIQSVTWPGSKDTCTIASEERIKRGYHLAIGRVLELPENKKWDIFNVILQSIPSRMLDVDGIYRGSGAAGAIVYAGKGEFVHEKDIWEGKLKPGAVIQGWWNRADYDLLRAGEITEGGKKRRLQESDIHYPAGSSLVFVRYDTDTNDRIRVRHYDKTQWMLKSYFNVWIAANVSSPQQPTNLDSSK